MVSILRGLGGGVRKIGGGVLKWQEMIQRLLSFNDSNELNYCIITYALRLPKVGKLELL